MTLGIGLATIFQITVLHTISRTPIADDDTAEGEGGGGSERAVNSEPNATP